MRTRADEGLWFGRRGGALLAVGALAAFAAVPLVAAPALAAAPAAAVRSVQPHATAPPFSCTTATIFLAQGTPGTVLEQETYGAGTTSFKQVGAASGWTYNSIGFDTVDDYIYGTSVSGGSEPTGHLLRIDATGGVTDLGALPNTTGNETAGFAAGAFDDSGTFYGASPEKNASGVLYELPITDPGAARTLTITKGGQAAEVEVFDFTYADGYLWGVDDLGGNADIDRIDPGNGDMISIPQSVMPVGGIYGAAWTLGNGNLGFSENDSGDVYQVAVHAPTSTAPTFSLVSKAAGPVSEENNDGTACSLDKVDLALAKTGPAQVATGATISWKLTVTDRSADPSSGYVVNDAVPSAVTGVATSTAGCTVSGNDVQCVEGLLKSGASRTITITGKAPDTPQSVTNKATVTGNEADPDTADDTASATTAVGGADLSISKTVGDATPTVGAQGTYTISVANAGPDAAAGVVVTDDLPAGTTYDSASASTGTASEVTSNGTQVVTWDVGTLDDAATAKLLVTVTFSATGSVVNTASVTSLTFDPGGTTQSASAAATVSAATTTTTTTTTLPGETTVPSTNTGEPWAGGLYWLLLGVAGAGGVLVLDGGRRRRRRRA
jgi:uncharacterized repeat protein (TIGR01451 family)